MEFGGSERETGLYTFTIEMILRYRHNQDGRNGNICTCIHSITFNTPHSSEILVEMSITQSDIEISLPPVSTVTRTLDNITFCKALSTNVWLLVTKSLMVGEEFIEF